MDEPPFGWSSRTSGAAGQSHPADPFRPVGCLRHAPRFSAMVLPDCRQTAQSANQMIADPAFNRCAITAANLSKKARVPSSILETTTSSICVLNPMNTAARPTRLCIVATSCGIWVICTRCATTQPIAPPTTIMTRLTRQLPCPHLPGEEAAKAVPGPNHRAVASDVGHRRQRIPLLRAADARHPTRCRRYAPVSQADPSNPASSKPGFRPEEPLSKRLSSSSYAGSHRNAAASLA